MVQYEDEDIEIVMEITGKDKAKAEKYLKSVIADVEDDTDDILDILDIIRAEQSYKENGGREYTVSEKKVATKKKGEKKINEDKKKIIDIIHKALVDNGYNATITNADKYIELDDIKMTINLVKHKK